MEITTLLNQLKAVKKVLITDKNTQLSGEDFVNNVLAISGVLKEQGVAQGTPVLVNLYNDVASVVALFAAWNQGALVFIGNPSNPIEQTAEIVKNFKIHTVAAGNSTIKALQAQFELMTINNNHTSYALGNLTAISIKENQHKIADVDQRAKNAAVAIFSSGSTGKPKAILNSFAHICENATHHAKAIGLKNTDVVGCVLPIFYSYGLVANLLSALLTHATVALQIPRSDIDDTWIVKNSVSVIALTPFFVRDITISSPSIRIMTFGGDALQMNAAKKIRDNHPKCELYSTYGLTEAGPRVATWRFDNCELPENDVAPLGVPLDCCSFSLLKQGDSGSHGELIVKTSTRMLGYYYGYEQGFEIPNWQDNTVNTDDIFKQVGNHYYFVGRDKDIIVQNGEKIFPAYIESLLLGMNNIIDARVIGVPDLTKGQQAEVFIHAKGDLDTRAVEHFLLSHLPRASMPTRYHLVNQIIRSETGKKIRESLFLNLMKNNLITT